jgi:hypothetical protein
MANSWSKDDQLSIICFESAAKQKYGAFPLLAPPDSSGFEVQYEPLNWAK